jgi:hypothetical protein
VARIHASESFGWLNLLLVWALFAILGLKLSQLRALPTPVKASVALLSLIAALILIHIGPYSAALISTPAVPGISNLAPPTVVLACVGVAQIFILLLIWPLLSRIMNRDRIWVPVAVFSARAMQLYLFHMLFLALGIGVMFLWGGTPTPLGVVWWAEHVAVFVVAIGSVWMLAPWLASAAAALNNFLGKVWPRCIVQRTATSPLWAVRTYVFVSALLVIIMSDSGVGRPFTTQPVVGIPQIPVVTVLLLFALVSLAGRVDAMSRLDPAVRD